MATAGPSLPGDETTVNTYRVIAAIDFGTTYSGFAFSFKDEYEENPTKVYTHNWKDGLDSQKTPTTILLNSCGEFEAFGFKAEERYTELADANDHIGYRYFKHFKMCLHNRKGKLTRDTVLTDEQGKAFPAMRVFSESIAYMKRTLLQQLKNWKTGRKSHRDVTDESIGWVLTVPAIWDEEAKQFMRMSAEEAGIEGKDLILALEPEAAAVYCKERNTRKKKNENNEAYLAAYDIDTTFMVLDLGGGTVDVTVSKVMEDRTLSQIFAPSGGAWGGIEVNKEFKNFIMDLVPKHKVLDILKEYKYELLKLEREIEMQKRNLVGDQNQCITLELGAFHEEITSPGRATLKKGKLKLPLPVVKDFFAPSVKQLVEHIDEIFNNPEASEVTDVILVGGFADCKIIKEAVKTHLRNLSVTCPEEAGLAVLKGAVLYGHHTGIISSRACQFTYGTEICRFFLEGYDDPEKRIFQENTPYCENIFNKLSEKGKIYNVGDRVETEVFPVRSTMTEMRLHLFKSTEKDPRYTTDEGCTSMGTMIVEMPDTTGGLERMVIVSLTFGKTELIYEGVDSNTGNKVEVRLDLLSN